jgi:hypothetical protein
VLSDVKMPIFALNIQIRKQMLNVKAGEIAGMIWNSLNETEGLTGKDIKKAAKLKTDKDLYLGLGWLLREGKISTSEVDGDIFVTLN